MTTERDNIVKAFADPVEFPIDATGSYDFKGGDLLFWDSSAKVVKPVVADASVQYLAGIAGNGSFLQPYSTKVYNKSVPVYQKVIASLLTTGSETYYHLTPVYAGADAQTVTTVAGSYIVGYCIMRPGASSLAAGTGVRVDVLLAPVEPTAYVA
jgi:hypothetical protein